MQTKTASEFRCCFCFVPLCALLFAVVHNLKVADLAIEIAGLLQGEYKCAYIVHLVLAALVVVDCLLVEGFNQFAIYI